MPIRITSYWDSPSEHGIDGRVDRLIAAIEHAGAQGEHPVVVGHSLGWIAILAALQAMAADRVRGVVAVGPVGHTPWSEVGPRSVMRAMYREAGLRQPAPGQVPTWRDGVISTGIFMRDIWPHARADFRGLLQQVHYALTTDATQDAVALSWKFKKRMLVLPCAFDQFAPAEQTEKRLRTTEIEGRGFEGEIDVVEAAHTDAFLRHASGQRIVQAIVGMHDQIAKAEPRTFGQRIFAGLSAIRWGHGGPSFDSTSTQLPTD